jgi:hypothetical protein
MTQRFTTDGGADLEKRLEQWCDGFTDGVRGIVPETILEAVVLGGGYGRGEGGVLRMENAEHAYNDLEFYIFVRGPLLLRERKYRGRLAELAHHWTEKTGIEFESKTLTFAKIQRAPVSMFYYDLVVGHRWLFGEAEEFANCEHHHAAHRIPLVEATRLLMNRASGLLFAKTLHATDSDFIRRNISKAQLAMGDVVLTASGRYHASCRERHRRLEKLEGDMPWLAEVLRHHAMGVAFKLHPYASTERPEALEAELAEVTQLAGKVFLWLEEKRLGVPFRSHREYAFHPVAKHPDTRKMRNALINFRTFGAKGIATRYPRERLLEALALLLWTPDALANADALAKLQKDLASAETTAEGLAQDYRKLWSRFN